jgi:transcriptional regulator with XRE-family HTH domain
MLQEYLDTQTFGERIKALRKQNNMTQEQLAETLYLENKATISSYENNCRIPSADILSEMARVSRKFIKRFA